MHTTRDIDFASHRVRVDLSTQRLELSIAERWIASEDPAAETRLYPTASAAIRPGFLAASVLLQKARQFDDGLYAAVEIAAQRGIGRFAGKQTLLPGLIRRISGRAGAESPLTHLTAAARLGGLTIDDTAHLDRAVADLTAHFLSDARRSKPLGFYTWSVELEGIFRQDRLLQDEMDAEAERAVIAAFSDDAALRATYDTYLSLASRLTNPPKPRRPSDAYRVFPPSASHEGDLIERLYGDRPIPDGFSLIDEIVRRIRAGDLSLAPTADSGWYDYQSWAHEAFVTPERMPEAEKLSFAANYRKRLVELFKGAQALARETHAKQLAVMMAGCALGSRARKAPLLLTVRPDLGIEPLAAYYLRRADGYRFVRRVLEDTFGADALSQMTRVGPNGAGARDLDTELAEIEMLFRGAYALTCRQIGLAPDHADGADTEALVARFAAWASRAGSDPDIGQDMRMMVPVFFDVRRQKMKVWLFLGWATDEVRVSFVRAPDVLVFDRSGQPVTLSEDLLVVFDDETHTVVYPVTAETYVDTLMDRTAFRAACDVFKTRSAIVSAMNPEHE